MSKHDNLLTNLLTHVLRVLPPLIYYTGIVTYSRRHVKGQAEELTVPAFFAADRLSERELHRRQWPQQLAARCPAKRQLLGVGTREVQGCALVE